jgi:hypothetical protein
MQEAQYASRRFNDLMLSFDYDLLDPNLRERERRFAERAHDLIVTDQKLASQIEHSPPPVLAGDLFQLYGGAETVNDSLSQLLNNLDANVTTIARSAAILAQRHQIGNALDAARKSQHAVDDVLSRQILAEDFEVMSCRVKHSSK